MGKPECPAARGAEYGDAGEQDAAARHTHHPPPPTGATQRGDHADDPDVGHDPGNRPARLGHPEGRMRNPHAFKPTLEHRGLAVPPRGKDEDEGLTPAQVSEVLGNWELVLARRMIRSEER